MPEGNESGLRFSLEESVWFQKGQEVSELISISLDPDITIHEDDQYVTIEGFLQLSGEYRKDQTGDAEEEVPSSPKFVQIVEHREDDVFEFIHQFPVDITIPVDRVKNIDEIEVVIDSFDYHLPERSCLKLVADLTISGLYEGEAKDGESGDPENQGEWIRPLHFEEAGTPDGLENDEIKPLISSVGEKENNLFVPFTVSARRQPEPEKMIHPDHETSGAQKEEKSYNSDEDTVPLFQLKKAATGSEEKQKTASLFSTNEDGPPLLEAREAEQSDEFDDEVEYDDEEDVTGKENLTAQAEEPASKKKKAKKEGISLAEFFARKEQEDDLTRLKVCIVQDGETIETIAERYDVSVQSILKVNDMDMNQDVYSGQVLYIPDHVVYR